MMVSRIRTWVIGLTLLLCLGFSNMSRAAQNADIHMFGVFWKQFSQAVIEDKRETVTDLAQLPFLMDGVEHVRSALLREYSTLFTRAMPRCFKKIESVHDLDGYCVGCGE